MQFSVTREKTREDDVDTNHPDFQLHEVILAIIFGNSDLENLQVVKLDSYNCYVFFYNQIKR